MIESDDPDSEYSRNTLERIPVHTEPVFSSREERLAYGVTQILHALEVDLNDRNFKGTPQRYAKFIKELFWAPRAHITSFPENHDQMVLLRNHECWTLCPHHLLPVRLDISVAYIPKGSVLGLSKLGRLFDDINTRPLMQETATDELCTRLYTETGEMGAAVVMRGHHLCMQMRGIKSSNCDAITSKLMGALRENPQTRQEFFHLVAPQLAL